MIEINVLVDLPLALNEDFDNDPEVEVIFSTKPTSKRVVFYHLCVSEEKAMMLILKHGDNAWKR